MYTLDANTAKKADNIGAYISETGKYVGTFIRAEKLVSANKGTHGIGFAFKTNSGQTTRFDIWTQRANGEALQGMNQIHALMACMSARKLTEANRRILKWDNDANAETLQDAVVFTEFMDKPIGLLLRAEEYEKMKEGVKTGENGWRMGLFAAFQADSELMASEILDRKTKPEQLEKVIKMLADKPLKAEKAKSTGSAPRNHKVDPSDIDDDIPF